MRRLIDYEPMTGVWTYHDYNHETKETTIETVQDVQPYLERNKKLAADPDYKKNGIKKEWLHAACIPIGVQAKWLSEKGVNLWDKNHWPEIKKLLNDPEWSYLRTSKTRF